MSARAWSITVISGTFLAWLAEELWFAFDDSPDTVPLTLVVVDHIPARDGIPLVVGFAVWLVVHFAAYYWAKPPTVPKEYDMQPSPPTQVKHPWRATVRTTVAGLVALLPVIIEVVTGLHLDATAAGGQVILYAGLVTRVLAMPGVDGWLREFVPFLAAQPKSPLSR